MIDYTFIYSSPCRETLNSLINCMVKTFGLPNTKLDDMFYVGVFCTPETYANYPWQDYFTRMEMSDNMAYPTIFLNHLASNDERIDVVKKTIKDVMRGEIEKPEWMVFVEETHSNNDYDQAPSSYLYLEPKDEQYREFGEKLIEFLYSPNWLIKLLR